MELQISNNHNRQKTNKSSSEETMGEVCAQCKNESQFTVAITKLLTSTCGHSLYVFNIISYYRNSCNVCIDRYINKREYSCPICGAQVRMQDLSEETADEREIKRIREARKQVFAIFDPSKLLTTTKYDEKTQIRCIKREEFCIALIHPSFTNSCWEIFGLEYNKR